MSGVLQAVIQNFRSFGAGFWIGNLGDSGSSDVGSGVGLDSSGNVYFFGFSDASGVQDFQLAKYNASGSIQWQRKLGSGTSNTSGECAVDPSGNVYFCGYSSSFLGRIGKYDSSGTLQWQRSLGGSGNTIIRSITASASNVYITATNSASGTNDCLIAKYNSSGAIQWQRTLDDGLAQNGVGIGIDSSENVYVTGSSNSGGNFDILIVKYNSSGTLQWQRTLGGE